MIETEEKQISHTCISTLDQIYLLVANVDHHTLNSMDTNRVRKSTVFLFIDRIYLRMSTKLLTEMTQERALSRIQFISFPFVVTVYYVPAFLFQMSSILLIAKLCWLIHTTIIPDQTINCKILSKLSSPHQSIPSLRKMELSFVIWIIVLDSGYIAFPVAKVFLTVFNKLIE
jgi:hypothetical protein